MSTQSFRIDKHVLQAADFERGRDVARSLSDQGEHLESAFVWAGICMLNADTNDLFQLGVSLRLAKRARAADAVHSQLRDLAHPARSKHLIEAALCKLDLDDPEAARAFFKESYDLAPSTTGAAWQGVALNRLGKTQQAIEWLNRALEIDPADITARTELAKSLEILKKFSAAAEIYEGLALVPAMAAFAFNRLATCLVAAGQTDRLEILLGSSAYRNSMITSYAIENTVLWALKAKILLPHHEIVEKLDQLPAQEKTHAVWDALILNLVALDEKSEQYGEYKARLVTNSYARSGMSLLSKYRLSEISEKLDSHHFISNAEAVHVICEKIRSRTPFCLIRLGDGEGNFLASYFEPANAFVARQQRRIVENWFGADVASRTETTELLSELRTAIANTDLLGVPDASRLRYESTNDCRGYWGVLFASQYALLVEPGPVFVSAVLHLDLFTPPFYEALSCSTAIHTITCHRDFGNSLRAKVGVLNGTDIIVPGEQGMSNLSLESKTGRHFPDIYQQVKQSIAGLDPGATVLIAAGVCGKVYAHMAKLSGCVAIDIGAYADYLMGADTRVIFTYPEFQQRNPKW